MSTRSAISPKPSVSTRRLLGISGLAWMFDAMDVGILSFVIAALAAEWQLSPTEMGWIGSVNSIGMAVGAVAFGMMADRFGRKNVFILTVLVFSIGSGVSALSTGLAMFLVLRFVIGAGLGGELPVASTLVSESVPADRRGRTVVLLESFWALGWIAAALLAYFVIPQYGWRVAMVITALPALYTVYLRLSLPDSPQSGTARAARRSLSSSVRAVFSSDYKKSTAMLWIVWFTVVFSYYGMFLWLPSVMVMKGFSLIKSFEYVLIMTLAQLPGYFLAAWMIERTGRKWTLTLFLAGTAASAFFFGNATTTAMLLASGMLLSFFNLGAWGALYAYTPEQYPAAIRGTGSGLAAGVGRIGGVLGPLLVGVLVAKGVAIGLIFAIFCAAIAAGILAVIALGSETRNRVLD